MKARVYKILWLIGLWDCEIGALLSTGKWTWKFWQTQLERQKKSYDFGVSIGYASGYEVGRKDGRQAVLNELQEMNERKR